eukprot:5097512-Amphidinium_carterae.1
MAARTCVHKWEHHAQGHRLKEACDNIGNAASGQVTGQCAEARGEGTMSRVMQPMHQKKKTPKGIVHKEIYPQK